MVNVHSNHDSKIFIDISMVNGYSNGLTWPLDHWHPLVTGLNKAWMVWDMSGTRKTAKKNSKRNYFGYRYDNTYTILCILYQYDSNHFWTLLNVPQIHSVDVKMLTPKDGIM